MMVSTIVAAVAVAALFICFTLIRPVRECSGNCGSCTGASDCALKERRS
ncbi:MAG: hypothetical protein Q7S20_11905 [Gemmatimonadaceae bacterium]|nr:hypothetical protein [Gemmatimonadaceae bacterium]